MDGQWCQSESVGRVYLVGAGPGAPGLMTLRGVECLRLADVVLYDYLVNPLILLHAASDAEQICLGRHGASRIWSQAEVNARMVESARAGKTVVRLKGGDPSIFGRVGEETEALAAAQIPYEVVPGVTAASAASCYAGISLTHRNQASAVAFVTGQEGSHKCESTLDFAALAAFPGPIVFYMGVTTAGEWSEALMQAGKPSTTSVCVVRRCSLPDQQVIDCHLGDVAATLQSLRPPAVVIVGADRDFARQSNWLQSLPLTGQTILVTRAAGQAESLERRLASLGASVLLQPAIEIVEPSDWREVDAAIENITAYQWVVFSSVNGVRSWMQRMWQLGRDSRHLALARLAAVGRGTADELAKYGLRADLVPPDFRAESLAGELVGRANGQHFLLVKGDRGRETLQTEIAKAGGVVDERVVYCSHDVLQPAPRIFEQMQEGRISWTTVTSPAIARSLANMFGDSLSRTRLVSISPLTSGVLRELGWEPAVQASEYHMDGIVSAICRGCGGSG